MDARQSAVLHRDLARVYPTIARGEGIYLWDTEGRRYIDGSGGSAAVTAIGHAVPEVIAAMTEQASHVAYSPTHAFTTDAVEACARRIIEDFAPPGFSRVWFVSGGSEATDNAVKMAIQYHRERGEGTRRVIIGRWQSYHGGTIAALAYGGNAARRAPYSGILPHAEHIPACHPYRCASCANRGGCDLTCADALDRTIRQIGRENVAAFMAEPVVGATLGASPAAPGYFQRIREICDYHGVLFIADEVMSGFGRTGRNFAIEHWGVTPDLITAAKGIAGGYTPLGAVIARPEFVSEISSRGKSFVIGHTSSCNPLSCAVGSAVMQYISEKKLVENAARVGAHFHRGLRSLADRHPIIGDVRGMGLLAGVELVADRDTKRPFPVAWGVGKRVGAATLERGLISYPGAGSADGVSGDHLLYAPPLIITEAQVDEMLAILDESLTAVASEMSQLG